MIEISADVSLDDALKGTIEQAAVTALCFYGLEHAVISILVTGDERMRELNRGYRSVDRTTDVLSFAAREGESLAAVGKHEFLGDLVISLDAARRQAEEYGHSIERESAFLTVHGTLHLLGFDHMTDEGERQMCNTQEEILERMGCPREDAGIRDENLMHDIEIKKMIRMALNVKDRAYVPYSGFHVGACLSSENGAYFMGCNVENSTYSPTICAERTAIVKAVSECERKFTAIAVVSDSEKIVTPCGTCRQMLSEFCSSDMPVICANNKGEFVVHTLGELLPESFGAEYLEKDVNAK